MGFKKSKSSIIEELEVAVTNEKARVASALQRLEQAEAKAKMAFLEAKEAKHYLDEIRTAVDYLYHIIYPPKPTGEPPV